MGVGSWPPQPHLITQTAEKTSAYALLGTSELRMRKKKFLKKECFNLPQLLFHCFNNVLLKQNNKQQAEIEKFCLPLKSICGNFESADRSVDEVDSGCDIFSLWYFHSGKIMPWSYESITKVNGIVPPMNYLRVQSNSADSDSYQNCKCEGAPHITIWSTAPDKMS